MRGAPGAGRGASGPAALGRDDAREAIEDRVGDEARARREHVAVAKPALLADEEAQRVDQTARKFLARVIAT